MSDETMGRALNVLAALLVGWLGYVLFSLVTDSGICPLVAQSFASPGGGSSGLGVFAMSFAIGLLPSLALAGAIGWALGRLRGSHEAG